MKMKEIHLTTNGKKMAAVNELVNYEDYPEVADYMQDPTVRLVFFVLYGFVFVAGNASNIAMLVVCLRQWCDAIRMPPSSSSSYVNAMSSAVTNALVTNLAIADIVLCVFSLTSTPFSYFSQEWPFGDFLCRFTPSTLILAVCVISFTSMVMAVDRHIAICYPHSTLRLNIRSSLIAIAAIWLASACACIPIFLSYKTTEESFEDPLKPYNESSQLLNITKCSEHWSTDTYRRVFSMCILAVQFLMPAFLIAYCYIGIFVALRNQKKFREGPKSFPLASSKHGEGSACRTSSNASGANGHSHGHGHSMASSAQRRLVRTTSILCAMILIFMACWMPINLLLLVADYYESENFWQTTSWFPLAYFAAHVLAMTSTMWNPLLYGWLNERLRPEILKICCVKRPAASATESPVQRMGSGATRTTTTDNTEETVTLTSTTAATMLTNNNINNGNAFHAVALFSQQKTEHKQQLEQLQTAANGDD